MCTRACVKIQDGTYIEDSLGRKTNCVITLYHHSDGYPSGVGKDLKKYLAEVVDKWAYWMSENIATNLVRGELDGDTGYEVAICEHSDCQYGYLIDCEKKSLTCYELGPGIGPWEHEVPIPDYLPAAPKEYHGGDEVWSKALSKNMTIMLAHRTQTAGSDDAKVDHYLTTDGYPLLPDEVEDKH